MQTTHSDALGRPHPADLAPYLAALQASSAGLVEIDLSEDPAVVEGLLQLAAEHLGMPVVTGWLGTRYEVLAWRRWPARPEPGLRVLAAEDRGALLAMEQLAHPGE